MRGGGFMADDVFVGIDVSKAQLDVAVRPCGEVWRVANDPAFFKGLTQRLTELAPCLIVMEATGGLEIPVAAALSRTGLPVVIVNPRQVREFARAIGQLAKNDRIGALTLAPFGERVPPQVRPLPGHPAQAIDALPAGRPQVVAM